MASENEKLQEEVLEKEDLVKAVNSLVKVNQHLQDEQNEYKALLNEAQREIDVLKQKQIR